MIFKMKKCGKCLKEGIDMQIHLTDNYRLDKEVDGVFKLFSKKDRTYVLLEVYTIEYAISWVFGEIK